jgi:NAD(P)-dependent dehydrogenase (short-subunit alcohol dehydrogenase family)
MIGPFRKSSKVSHNALAVVTGAGSGIGAAFAVELARRGGRIVCSDINEVAAAKTVSAIGDQGGEAVAIACDVTRFDDVRELAAQSESWFGGAPTLVINNAGVGSGGASIGELSLEDWQWVLGINLWGPIHGCHVFAPILRSAEPSNIPRGIINVASDAAFGAAPSMAAYNVSKAGVLSLSETLAAELSGSAIKVTVLCPTFVKTNIVGPTILSAPPTPKSAKALRGARLGVAPA